MRPAAGHDENVSYETMAADRAEERRTLTLDLYHLGAALSASTAQARSSRLPPHSG